MKKRNSFLQILEVLSTEEFLTENEIFIEAFGYDRNNSHEANKKYADMLRRCKYNKYIGRINNRLVIVRPQEEIGKAMWLYFIKPKGLEMLNLN